MKAVYVCQLAMPEKLAVYKKVKACLLSWGAYNWEAVRGIMDGKSLIWFEVEHGIMEKDL